SIEDVKKELIGRRLEFVKLQELDTARQQVVTVTELNDPLIDDPVRLINIDYDGDTLSLILSQPVHNAWVNSFSNMHHRQALMWYGPERFSFRGNMATVPINNRDDIAQDIVNYFKSWLPIATQQYEADMRREKEGSLGLPVREPIFSGRLRATD